MAVTTYSLVASFNVGGQFAQNVLHYQFDDSSYGDTASAAAALINAFDAANTTHFRNLLPTSTTILSYRGRNVISGGGFEAIKLLSAITGTRTGVLSAAGLSPVAVLFPTANAKPRGRVFLAGVTDDDCTDGEYASTFRTAFTTHAVLFVNTITLAGGATPVATPVILSRKTVPGTSYAVEYARLSDMVGTQRRRMRPA